MHKSNTKCKTMCKHLLFSVEVYLQQSHLLMVYEHDVVSVYGDGKFGFLM